MTIYQITLDGELVDTQPSHYERAMALLREAVTVARAHTAAVRMTPDERAAHPETWRLPELDLRTWYAKAGALVDEVDG
jgi:hypothetical protein